METFIQRSRLAVLNCLKKNINGRERGLAEALLVGFKDDLDKELVQSYSRTGVVHIIAISGMHLALIYGMLMWITIPLKKIRFLRTLIILSGLWLFTLMAGAQASVVRSAVMFTCIAIGLLSGRKSSTYNTLSLSAFLLLCYQPFWLWDIGFQLSYAAVLSILLFYTKVYNVMFFKNKTLDAIWKILAISLAAQIVTTPLTLYHFHQFPVLFLLTNVLAVPLSGLILFGEILLCLLSWSETAGYIVGKVVAQMIAMMNHYIERMDSISFAVWEGFSISVLQVLLLYILISASAWWLAEKNRKGCYISLLSILAFGCLRLFSFRNAMNQERVIIYNTPKHTATAIVYGRRGYLFADSTLYADHQTMKMNIFPSKFVFRLKSVQAFTSVPVICFNNQRMLVYDSTIQLITFSGKFKADLVILSNHFRQNISRINTIDTSVWVIADNTVPSWKAAIWKRQCDSLGIHFHSISENGAFVMKL
jgi:competence protein ComEC